MCTLDRPEFLRALPKAVPSKITVLTDNGSGFAQHTD